jgi:hypothetical protein
VLKLGGDPWCTWLNAPSRRINFTCFNSLSLSCRALFGQDVFSEGLSLGNFPVDGSELCNFLYHCDNGPLPLSFMKMNSRSKTLFRNAEELTNITAQTANGGCEAVPTGEISTSGVVCKSRSKLNAHRNEYRNSYTTGAGESADSFHTKLAVDKAKPGLISIIETASWIHQRVGLFYLCSSHTILAVIETGQVPALYA